MEHDDDYYWYEYSFVVHAGILHRHRRHHLEHHFHRLLKHRKSNLRRFYVSIEVIVQCDRSRQVWVF